MEQLLELVHDRMTECVYLLPLESFDSGLLPQPTTIIPIVENGEALLRKVNKELGLAFDEQDIHFYIQLFRKLGRNPTNVELFDLSQSNSEHSRHWFFKGKLVINEKEIPDSLMHIVQQPLRYQILRDLKNHLQDVDIYRNDHISKLLRLNQQIIERGKCEGQKLCNSVIAFGDNSSAIRGHLVRGLFPENPIEPSRIKSDDVIYDLLFTAETHNFPTGVAPRPGAATGIGGRIRDGHATGRGSLVIAGTAGYCVGNLHIPGYEQVWEDRRFRYPGFLATPLRVLLQASDGASDYGNAFGEPIIQGFTRSFGLRIPSKLRDLSERREWVKPIMFTGGIGQLDRQHLYKGEPTKHMLLAKIGGPAYRIGIGGGSASSVMQGERQEELDFSAVQRGDPEMGQRLHRVVRSCVEQRERNPIISIHDQGAGGCANVVKEIVDPQGAIVDIRKILVGDTSLSVLEIWVGEYQEQDALLIQAEHREWFEQLCKRERLPVAFIGFVSGDGIITVQDSYSTAIRTPVNLPLKEVLDDTLRRKTFYCNTSSEGQKHLSERDSEFHWQSSLELSDLSLPPNLQILSALNQVLRLISVGCKAFLTNKVDRSVTGLIAQQQCVGPLQLPLSNVAVVSHSYFEVTGGAMSIGEQPIKGLINPGAMARMSIGESLTNLLWAQISSLSDVKCSGNWMWPAKMPGEAANIYEAAISARDMMLVLGIAIDGGKDSLSMAARVPEEESINDTQQSIVKAPGSLVISSYVSCSDITNTVTPDIKLAGQSKLIFIDLSSSDSQHPIGRHRLGGSALAQVFSQIGNESPDVEDVLLLKRTFCIIQKMILNRLIAAGHDRSDGGLITTILEMCFSGNCGVQLEFHSEWIIEPGETGNENDSSKFQRDSLAFFFAEELGIVLEIERGSNYQEAINLLEENHIPYKFIGNTTTEKIIRIIARETNDPSNMSTILLEESMIVLRDIWNETSAKLEALQANPKCVSEETIGLKERQGLRYHFPSSSLIPPLDAFDISNSKKNRPTRLTTETKVSTESETEIKEKISGNNQERKRIPLELLTSTIVNRPQVAILREEGSNGDKEMHAAFYIAGFDVWDVMMSDLLSKRVSLSQFQGLVFVGGFSYADVLGSAKGWAGVIRFNQMLWESFQEFYKRRDTFSLGVCNGCQLMALLGWVGRDKTIENSKRKNRIGYDNNEGRTIEDQKRPEFSYENDDDIGVRFITNESGRFESRFVLVQIERSSSVLLRGLEGSTLGIWSSHCSGNAYVQLSARGISFEHEKFGDSGVDLKVSDINEQTQFEQEQEQEQEHFISVRYVGEFSESPTHLPYPQNPSGSWKNIAAITSSNGRHLAIMPHPERSFLEWQWPYRPWNIDRNRRLDVKKNSSVLFTPWMRLFQNAREFCINGGE